jgi:hypothetical protein
VLSLPYQRPFVADFYGCVVEINAVDRWDDNLFARSRWSFASDLFWFARRCRTGRNRDANDEESCQLQNNEIESWLMDWKAQNQKLTVSSFISDTEFYQLDVSKQTAKLVKLLRRVSSFDAAITRQVL